MRFAKVVVLRLFHRQGKAAPGARTRPSAAAADLVCRHPGLALVVAADGTVTSASESIRPLVAAGPSGAWWEDLYGWLSRPDEDDGPVRLLPLDADGATAMVEWTAVTLPDNTVALFGRDVTLDLNLRDALAESRQRFRDLVDISSDFAWETGSDGRFVYVSPEGALGYSAEALVGRDPDDLLEEHRSVTRSPFQARQPVNRAELWLRRSDGEDACVVAWARPLVDETGAWRGTRGLCREVTETRRRSVTHRADLEEPERIAHHRRSEHLLQGELLSEARVLVVRRHLVRLDRDPCQLLLGAVVPVHHHRRAHEGRDGEEGQGRKLRGRQRALRLHP